MSEVSPAALPLIRTSLGLTATASIRSPLATEMRWIFIGLSIIRLLPTVTTSLPGAPLGAASWALVLSSLPARPAGGEQNHTDAIRTLAIRSLDTYLTSGVPPNFFSVLVPPEMISMTKGISLGGAGGAATRTGAGATTGRGRDGASDGAGALPLLKRRWRAVPGVLAISWSKGFRRTS